MLRDMGTLSDAQRRFAQAAARHRDRRSAVPGSRDARRRQQRRHAGRGDRHRDAARDNLQDVPQSVTALSTEFIEKQALTNLYDLVERAALRSTSSATWPGQNSIIIRGITTGSAQYRIDSQVSVYLDEQPMTSITQQADVRLIDIERVELLPGPAGHAVRIERAGGNPPLRHEQAGRQRLCERARPRGRHDEGRRARVTTSAAGSTFRSPTTSRCGPSGFWSKEGGYVDNVLGPTLMGETTNADIAEEGPELLSPERRPPRGTLGDQSELEPARHGHLPAQRDGRHLGNRSLPRREQDHALLRRLARRQVVHDVGDAEGRPRLRRAVGDRELLQSQDQLRVRRHELLPVAHARITARTTRSTTPARCIR